ncbi:PREDICTED: trichohyalin-like [Rhagoletis zephyria]|uniref:trichohyalin-like n=1 Tax=Rhagoletis zephyria TaxID=28612 RepID=UPI00081156EF|nr:PREDICTED: trichohyalin-like [Rhagoletis zephyria]
MIDFENVTLNSLIIELRRRGYDSNPVDQFNEKASDYSYLLSLPISSFSEDGFEALIKTRDGKREKLSQHRQITPERMWIRDLMKFIQKFKEEEEEENNLMNSLLQPDHLPAENGEKIEPETLTEKQVNKHLGLADTRWTNNEVRKYKRRTSQVYREKKQEYERMYREKHSDRVREAKRKYAEKTREQKRKKELERYYKNREAILEKRRKTLDPEKVREYNQKYLEENFAEIREKQRIYREKNRDRINAQQKRRYHEAKGQKK